MGDGIPTHDFLQPHLLDIVADSINAAVLVYDREDVIVFASAQIRSFLPALSTSPPPGMRLRDLFGSIHDHGGYWPNRPDRPKDEAIGREDWIAGEVASLWKERSEAVVQRDADRWMSLTKRRLASGYGICVIRDVSEHRKREDQWRADLDRVQVTEEILDNLPFPIIVKDRTLAYVAVNKAACALYGRDADRILGRKSGDFHAAEFADRVDRVNRQVLDTGTPDQIAEQVIRPDGSSSIIVTRKFRVGKPGRYLAVTVMEDLSEAMATGICPEGMLAGLEGVDFVHSDMRPIDGALDNAQNGSAADIAGRKVLMVTESAATEEQAVALMLRAGLDATAARGLAEMEAIVDIARERDVSIDLIVLDGAMDIACLEAAQATGIDVLVLEAFQIEPELIRSVRLHLTQPQASAAAEVEDPILQVAENPSIDVLVAEDNHVNQIVFSQILEGFGYRYAVAADGEEAVRLWRELNPRMVLMDITLPKLNGFEAASKIRETEEIPGRTPIIGVLSPAVEGDREACWAAGMDDVVMKPLSPDILEEKFRKFMGNDFRKWREA